jgi:hypothetical protein
MEEKKEKGLPPITVALMIGTAIFFDALQMLLDFIFMGWLVTIFASMTFWFWFKMHGYSFMKPGRIAGSLITMLTDIVPILGWFSWTIAICAFTLQNKLQEVVPGADVTKLDIMKRK